MTADIQHKKINDDIRSIDYQSDEMQVRAMNETNAKASKYIHSGIDNKIGELRMNSMQKETPQFMSNTHDQNEFKLEKLVKAGISEYTPKPLAPIDDSACRRLEEEKSRLIELLSKAKDKNRQLRNTPRPNKGNKNAIPGFPVEKLDDFESQLTSLKHLEQEKKEKISNAKDRLKESLKKKHDGLIELDNLKNKILNFKENSTKINKELDLKKTELLSETLSYNSQLEKTLNTPEDFRLLRYFKDRSDTSKQISNDRREYCGESVTLTEDNLPRNFITDMEDEDIIRLKFLTAKKKGIFYEDDSLKVAVKQAIKDGKCCGFVLRFISKRDKPEWIDASFAGNHRSFGFSVERRKFEIEPSEFYDLEFVVTKRPDKEVPSIQIKAKKGEADELFITTVTVPIAVNWYYPHVRLAKSQYNYLWNSSKGYLVQSEMREIDKTLFAGEAELLTFIENLRLVETTKRNLPR